MVPRNFLKNLLPLLWMVSPVFSGVAATGTLGVQALSGFGKMNFGYNVAGYYKFDDQVLLGLQTGQGIVHDASAVPVLAAAYMRLPIGRIVVPVATGSLGFVYGTPVSGLMWRAGGLLDIRNGKHSSVILGPEYEGYSHYSGGIVLRAGFLLEL